MKCKCGNDRFIAHQICRHDIVVDEQGSFIKDHGIYDSGAPYGPFTCTICGAESDELPQNKVEMQRSRKIEAIMLKAIFSDSDNA